MTHAEAVAFVAALPGVPQEVIEALEGGLSAAELERERMRFEADTARSDLRLREAELNVTKGRLEAHTKRLAEAPPCPF